jgi:membrane-associated phospholipid phosphatase
VIERGALEWLSHHRAEWVTRCAHGLLALGTNRPFLALIALGVLALALVRRHRRVAVAVLTSAALSVLGSLVLKQLVRRPRPPAALALVQVDGFSMPSTDAALTAAVAWVLAVVVLRAHSHARAVLLGLLATGLVGVGATLLYLGVHWPTDVLAGWVVGAASAAAALRVVGMPKRNESAPKGVLRRTVGWRRPAISGGSGASGGAR